MKTKIIHDKEGLHHFLRKEAGLQLYLIGDLDDFFWPETTWYALSTEQEIKAVALLYKGQEPTTLLCFQKKEREYAVRLLEEIRPLLPQRFYAHLGEGFVDVLGRRNVSEHYGLNYKMTLQKKVSQPTDNSIRRLTVSDLADIELLYTIAYPHNWFDNRMLLTGKYFGCFEDGLLVGVAGIHVYSPCYGVAALGNIAVLPVFRNRKIGSRLTQTLCFDLQQEGIDIGLNVRAANASALRMYHNLGFRTEGTYEECLFTFPKP